MLRAVRAWASSSRVKLPPPAARVSRRSPAMALRCGCVRCATSSRHRATSASPSMRTDGRRGSRPRPPCTDARRPRPSNGGPSGRTSSRPTRRRAGVRSSPGTSDLLPACGSSPTAATSRRRSHASARSCWSSSRCSPAPCPSPAHSASPSPPAACSGRSPRWRPGSPCHPSSDSGTACVWAGTVSTPMRSPRSCRPVCA